MKRSFVFIFLLTLSLDIVLGQTSPPTVYFIGGSTTSYYPPSRYPRMGWGQAMPRFFSSSVHFSNQAAEGRSTKSFRDEGKWQAVLNELQPGDYVFIQFGHNDQKAHKPKLYTEPFTTFADNLRRYVAETRSKQATPVLVTSVNRRRFDKAGRLRNTMGAYPVATRKVAEELGVLLVDFHAATDTLFNKLGPEKTKELFMWLTPGESANYPEGVQDNTHLTEKGAETMARIVVRSLRQNEPALAQYLR